MDFWTAIVEIGRALPGGAIAGAIVSWLRASAATKRASRNALDDLKNEIVAEAVVYFSSNGQDKTAEQRLVRLCQTFDAKMVKHVATYGSKEAKSKVRSILGRLHNQVTGGDFATAARVRDSNRATLCKARLKDAMDLIK